ncbi:aminopeptidase [Ramlibacter tataouinensis]|uniref:Aminopeptidase n=1 Tax=Ramlibacter tataouinensis TaxID=94132 RepID=A0A127K002_9BURK|nr:aminopeptidase [Ramlibacter tataouinensis]
MAALLLSSLAGCSNVGYYWQSATGHLRMMSAARPVDDWLGDTQTPERLRDRLALSQRIRNFAVSELMLPDNPSYRRYADLQRPAVVWNVVAAPPYSLTLTQSCFPVTGCVGYRGYFDESEARAEAGRLAAQGQETSVYPVPAYSTLGWMNWAGGDPLLNTFINYPEGELARIIFHELAHQVVYANGDTMFNESFATAVERIGGKRWLETHASEPVRREYEQYDGRRRQFRGLVRATSDTLRAIYEQAGGEERGKLKQEALQRFREDYAQLRASWPGEPARYRFYDRWVAEANNASFGAQAAYEELVPGFEALFAREGGDFLRFYDAARALARLPKAERHQQLKSKESSGA